MPPRPVRPGTFHVTIRNVRGMYLLSPVGQLRLKQVILYLIAYVARKFGLQIHEITVMSNHIHIMFTDVHGNRPAAMTLLNALLARQINALRGQTGTVFETYWAGEKLDDDATLTNAVYVLANPVKHHIVERASEWTGVTTLRMEYGESRTIRRPAVGLWADLEAKGRRAAAERNTPMSPGRAKYRGKPSTLPAEVTLTLVRPPVDRDVSDSELRAEVRQRVRATEDELIAQRRANGTSVLGMDGLRELAQAEGRTQQSPKARRALMGEVPRYAGSPELVARRKAEDRDFVRRYKLALERLLKGERDVVWPEYTWKLRMQYGLPCDGTPTWPVRLDAPHQAA